jgi:hypothetical protein
MLPLGNWDDTPSTLLVDELYGSEFVIFNSWTISSHTILKSFINLFYLVRLSLT